MSVYQFHKKQFIPASMEEVWDFISSPRNLKVITPDYLNFSIKSNHLTDKMYAGMMILYTVKPLLNIKMNWLTEITQVKEKKFFIDEQRLGPYKIWHHEHHIEVVDGGVMMTDLITYQPPLGFMGRWVNKLFIRKKINEIFEYREKTLAHIFIKK